MNLRDSNESQFYRLLALPIGGRCGKIRLSKRKILCKNEKGSESRQTPGTLRPGQSAQDFSLSELAKVFNEGKNLSGLSAFFDFWFGVFRRGRLHLRRRGPPEFPNCFSVIQLSNNKKGAARICFTSWKLCVAAPKTFFEFDPFGKSLAKFFCFGSGNAAPAISNLFFFLTD